MKKPLLFLMASLWCVGVAHSQEAPNNEPLLNKRGFRILPEKGDWSLGIDTSPIFQYAGNLLSSAINNNTRYIDQPSMGLFVKKMINDKRAIRTGLIWNQDYQVRYFAVANDRARLTNANSTEVVFDKENLNAYSFRLMAGLENRIGNGRVQGIYGAQVSLGTNRLVYNYEYGNDLIPENNYQRTSFFGQNYFSEIDDFAFFTKREFVNNYSVSPMVFLGLEYFFAPKISIGGEFRYGLDVRFGKKGNSEYEYVRDGNIIKGSSENIWRNRGFGTGFLGGGQLMLIFYM